MAATLKHGPDLICGEISPQIKSGPHSLIDSHLQVWVHPPSSHHRSNQVHAVTATCKFGCTPRSTVVSWWSICKCPFVNKCPTASATAVTVCKYAWCAVAATVTTSRCCFHLEPSCEGSSNLCNQMLCRVECFTNTPFGLDFRLQLLNPMPQWLHL
jgi:hypothetical protein